MARLVVREPLHRSARAREPRLHALATFDLRLGDLRYRPERRELGLVFLASLHARQRLLEVREAILLLAFFGDALDHQPLLRSSGVELGFLLLKALGRLQRVARAPLHVPQALERAVELLLPAWQKQRRALVLERREQLSHPWTARAGIEQGLADASL